LLYINDLPGSINNLSKPTLFADDTNIIFTHPHPSEFTVNSNIVFEKITNWFQINLSLNLGKTYYIQCMSKISHSVNINITIKLTDITSWVQRRKTECSEHTSRMADNQLVRKVRDGIPEGKRNRGRPMKRWRDALE